MRTPITAAPSVPASAMPSTATDCALTPVFLMTVEPPAAVEPPVEPPVVVLAASMEPAKLCVVASGAETEPVTVATPFATLMLSTVTVTPARARIATP